LAARLPTFGPAHVVLVLALVLIALFVYASAQTAARSYQLREDQRALTVEVEELRADRAELTGLLHWMQTDEYAELLARQQLGLAHPGEMIVEVDAPETPVDDTQEPGEAWWELLLR
jgi:cell division protein FtsB